MAKNQTGINTENVEKTEETKEISQDRKFSLTTLRGNCVKLFGCTSSTFDGAFFHADKTKEYTIAAAEVIIKKWLGRGIGK